MSKHSDSNLKTPEFTRAAIKNYQDKLFRKTLSLDPRKDDDNTLIEFMESEMAKPDENFQTVMKRALRLQMRLQQVRRKIRRK